MATPTQNETLSRTSCNASYLNVHMAQRIKFDFPRTFSKAGVPPDTVSLPTWSQE